MEQPMRFRGSLALAALVLFAGCGRKDAAKKPVEYARFQGQEIARIALTLQPRPTRAILFGYTTPTGNEFLSGVMNACAEELAAARVPAQTVVFEADLMGLQTGVAGVAGEAVEEARRKDPAADVYISFAGLPPRLETQADRWVVFSPDPVSARAAVQSGAVRVAVCPRTGPMPAGAAETNESRFAGEYEVLRSP